MTIFGLHITTKKKFESIIAELQAKLDEDEKVLEAAFEAFPLVLDQKVYDIALKNDKGRYTKANPSFEHSTITEVIVDEKNYFNLVNRFRRNDVFFEREEAEEYLKSVCKAPKK
jgi:hypothetical protein